MNIAQVGRDPLDKCRTCGYARIDHWRAYASHRASYSRQTVRAYVLTDAGRRAIALADLLGPAPNAAEVFKAVTQEAP